MMVLTYLVNTFENDDLDILFSNAREAALYNDSKKLRLKHGDKRAKIIRRRLDELHAANTLQDLQGIGRCHEWKEDKDFIISIDLDGPYRLLFVPAHDPLPTKSDGGLDRDRVLAIRIIGINDPHG